MVRLLVRANPKDDGDAQDDSSDAKSHRYDLLGSHQTRPMQKSGNGELVRTEQRPALGRG